MAKADLADEVQVLRFFEQGSIEIVEVMYRLVSEKMRERLRSTEDECGALRQPASPVKKRESPASRKAPAPDVPERTPTE